MNSNTDTQVLDQNIADAIHKCAKEIGAAVVNGRRTCIRCIHFQEGSEQCRLANSRPPARVIAYGCTAFVEEEDIPF